MGGGGVRERGREGGAVVQVCPCRAESLDWKKQRVYDLWKKRQDTQEEYKDVVTLCTEKIGSSKALVDTVVTDN